MTSVPKADVRDAVVELADRRSYIKPRHVARRVGADTDAHRSIGHHLSSLADEGLVERWSANDSVNGTTWRILADAADDEPEAIADGGVVEPEFLDVVEAPDGHTCQFWGAGDEPEPCDNDAEYLVVYDGSTASDETVPRNVFGCGECFTPPEDLEPEAVTDGGHDLAALREGIASTVAADDDRARCYGDYAFRASDDWTQPGKHVCVDYDGDPFWLVLPFGFADVVCDAITERLDDADDEPVAMTDGGGFDITLDRTHVRDGEDIKELWKATVDNADAYQQCGGDTPGDALRGLAAEFDDVLGAEPRGPGGDDS